MIALHQIPAYSVCYQLQSISTVGIGLLGQSLQGHYSQNAAGNVEAPFLTNSKLTDEWSISGPHVKFCSSWPNLWRLKPNSGLKNSWSSGGHRWMNRQFSARVPNCSCRMLPLLEGCSDSYPLAASSEGLVARCEQALLSIGLVVGSGYEWNLP
jgi:hypothetical protein